jgi:hypothetical protein
MLDPSKLHWFPIREARRRDAFAFETLLEREVVLAP